MTPSPLRVSVLYALGAMVWIVGSDLGGQWWRGEPLAGVGWQIGKGGVFVCVTAIWLYALIRWFVREREGAEKARRRETEVAEAKLARLRNLNGVLLQVNRAALDPADPDALAREVVEALARQPNLCLATIQWVDEASGAVRPAVSAGHAIGYLNEISISVMPDSPNSSGPTGRAIRAQRPEVCNDIAVDARMRPWREAAARRGIRASACVPLKTAAKRGALTAYSDICGYFDEEITLLMERLMVDVAHGLDLAAARLSRVQASVALADALALNRAALEASPMGVIVFDPRGCVVEASAAAARLLGAAPEQLKSMNFQDDPIWRENGLVDAAERAETGRVTVETEAAFTTSFGRDVHLEITLCPFRVGDEPRLLMVFADVARDRKNVERLQLLDAALRAVPSAVVITDPVGRIVWVNPAFTQLTGYECEEVDGLTPRILRSGQQDDKFYAELWETISAGRVWNGELVNRRKDGSTYWEQMVIAPICGASGAIHHFVAIKRDITGERQLEQRTLRAQRLEGIGLLAGGIAHDLNNILAPILLASELFLMRATDPHDRAQYELVFNSAKRGAGIVRQILTFARGVDGERASLRPEHLVKELRNFMQETLPRRIELVTDLARDLPAVSGDATQLHQVLMNLAINARDAIAGSGVITLGARAREMQGERITQSGLAIQPGPYVEFFVRDTGTGMAAEVAERIFDPFFTTKPKGQGTGLGLPTILGIVRSHRGGIDYDTAPGRGSEFRVLLPAEIVAAGADAEVRPVPEVVGGGRRVLLVDDEAPVRVFAGGLLRRLGFEVDEARDGHDALARFHAAPESYAVVLLDLVMPRLGGDKVAEAIQALRPGLPIILISGIVFEGDSQQEQDTAAAFLRWGENCLGKPFTRSDLLRALAKAVPASCVVKPGATAP